MFEVLLVEDNPADARLTREAFAETRYGTRLSVVTDGYEALRFLRRLGQYADAPRPDLILLDLNMPKLDGCGLLAQIKRDDDLRRIPVIMLTTSAADSDVLRCYNLHVNSYVPKPPDLERFLDVVAKLKYFWFGVVRLPPK
ncbi:MAG: response regulator [Gemmatales bacterium]|nr:response regulator [Gemmatales bacterium]MDW8387052.1 response regulator [Gemmatales bacterium]